MQESETAKVRPLSNEEDFEQIVSLLIFGTINSEKSFIILTSDFPFFRYTVSDNTTGSYCILFFEKIEILIIR